MAARGWLEGMHGGADVSAQGRHGAQWQLP